MKPTNTHPTPPWFAFWHAFMEVLLPSRPHRGRRKPPPIPVQARLAPMHGAQQPAAQA
ncbi:MAG: hypothetical protein PHI64_13675 [Zoogloea sp.]|uniref:hypothetical protein n=1 Tax=Zoogloea sp. TaxID=49181 RepID=UPI00260DBB49|nr:hypothetical protein [Zoogloea sp.]MDD2990001.1 hypothetical protein [Zoogloea sp.]